MGRQATFVDYTECGIVTMPTAKHDTDKYYALKLKSKVSISKAIREKYDLTVAEFNDRIQLRASFKVAELIDFRTLIQFHKDLEKFPTP